MKTIIITCCGGELVPYILKDLRRIYRDDNIKMIGLNGGNIAYAALPYLDHFYEVPFGNSPDYISFVEKIIQKHNVDLIIPLSDEETINIINHAHIFEGLNCKIATPSSSAIELSSNKETTYKTLKDNNIAVPDFVVIERKSDIQVALSDFSKCYESYVLKPAISRGGRDVFVIDNSFQNYEIHTRNRQSYCNSFTFIEKLVPEIEFNSNLLLMERLVEPSYDVDTLSWNGESLVTLPRKRHNPDGLPYTGYSLENNSKIVNLVNKTAKIVDISHLYDVDVMMGKDGTPKVMEINPRPSGSIAYAHFSGIPVMHYLIELHLNDNWKKPDDKIREQSIYPFNDLIESSESSV